MKDGNTPATANRHALSDLRSFCSIFRRVEENFRSFNKFAFSVALGACHRTLLIVNRSGQNLHQLSSLNFPWILNCGKRNLIHTRLNHHTVDFLVYNLYKKLVKLFKKACSQWNHGGNRSYAWLGHMLKICPQAPFARNFLKPLAPSCFFHVGIHFIFATLVPDKNYNLHFHS